MRSSVFVAANNPVAVVMTVAVPMRTPASRALLARRVALQQLQQTLVDVLRVRLLRRLARRLLHDALRARSALRALRLARARRALAATELPRHASRFLQVLPRVGRLRIDAQRGLERRDALLHLPELHQSTTYTQRGSDTQHRARCTPRRTWEPTRSRRCSSESPPGISLRGRAPRPAPDAARPTCGFGPTACAGILLPEGRTGPATSRRTR